MSESKRDKIKRQIQALMDKADSTDFDAERDAILSKVDGLMFQYTIEEWELEQQRKTNGAKQAAAAAPTKSQIFVCGPDNPLEQQLADLTAAIADHTRCKIVYHGFNSKYSDTKCTIFGFPSDVDYFEILFHSLHIQLARQLEPKPTAELSWIENLVMLKEAGQKWQRIHQLLQSHPGYPNKGREWVRPIGVNFTKVYSDYCKAQEKEQFKTSPITWQKNFADEYVRTIRNRFWQIRREQPYEGTMALAVRDRSTEVTELLKETFPHLGVMKPRSEGKWDGKARAAGRDAGSRADISGGRGGVAAGSKGALPR